MALCLENEARQDRLPRGVTLLARLRHDGDAEAWKTFVNLYTPLVFRSAASRGLQDADARDVTQQVLAIVHRTIGKFEYDRAAGTLSGTGWGP